LLKTYNSYIWYSFKYSLHVILTLLLWIFVFYVVIFIKWSSIECNTTDPFFLSANWRLSKVKKLSIKIAQYREPVKMKVIYCSLLCNLSLYPERIPLILINYSFPPAISHLSTCMCNIIIDLKCVSENLSLKCNISFSAQERYLINKPLLISYHNTK